MSDPLTNDLATVGASATMRMGGSSAFWYLGDMSLCYGVNPLERTHYCLGKHGEGCIYWATRTP